MGTPMRTMSEVVHPVVAGAAVTVLGVAVAGAVTGAPETVLVVAAAGAVTGAPAMETQAGHRVKNPI